MDLLAIVRGKEQELRHLRSEVAVAYGPDGSIVLEKSARVGEEYEIEFADAEVERLRRVGNAVLTHNHPRGWNYPESDPGHSGCSFSLEDILLACRAELAEVRAVTPRLTFSMKPPRESGWTEATWETEIQPLYQLVYPQVKSRLFAAALRGELPPAEASIRLDHETWAEVARILGLRYNRVEE